ncbi:MAG: hypothetical protein DCF25_10145 [Leptolyngbya foveolarum]|uniref:Uncharacterized protein n=1 Tax=Leptolyngbya foveolarum TaxID=47253 RepID=A0A2W4W0U8_9CYAN|nr:MAG: hypothetical protein DCF25_10145 [Leptolyngbya foveolarum]
MVNGQTLSTEQNADKSTHRDSVQTATKNADKGIYGDSVQTTIENAAEDTAQGTTLRTKRVLWVTGGKGGTGKSTFARGALDALLAAETNVSAFDGDLGNPQLHRYYQNIGQGVTRTLLAQRDGGDHILEAMEDQQPDVILVDVAAGGTQILMRLQDESLFLSSAEELGYGFTVITVLSPIKDSVQMLKEAMDITQDHNVQHVVVKNLHFGPEEDFELFDASSTKQRFEASGGIVLTMRDLLSKTYGAIDKDNLPFSTATQKESGLPRGDRNRIKQWLTDFQDQMKLANGALGL